MPFNQCPHEQVGGGEVGRQRNVVNIANAEQHLDVGIVRMLVEWVDQEDHGVDIVGHHSSGDLRVSPGRAGLEALDIQTDLVSEKAARRPCRYQSPAGERVAIEHREGHEVRLFSVVGDHGEGQCRHVLIMAGHS